VLLARTDLPPRVFSVANPQEDRFTNRLVLSNPVLGTIVIPRGWVAVDATLLGRTSRVVSTHLERLDPAVQEGQGQELLDGPLNTSLPSVLLGDLNSAANGVGAVPGESDTRTRDNLLAAGFTDAWDVGKRDSDNGDADNGGDNTAGFTCCQDSDLRNPRSKLSERIDYVLFRGGFNALATRRVGASPADRTASGLWPSDHAGVWSLLRLPGDNGDNGNGVNGNGDNGGNADTLNGGPETPGLLHGLPLLGIPA
jgi:endonuclease/exonuclease/phosphatase family metal-dependent hydrolase